MKPISLTDFITLTLLNWAHVIINHTPRLFWRIVFVLLDVANFWFTRIISIIRYSPARSLRRAADSANTYEEYEEISLELDRLDGCDVWRQNFASKRYDYKMIHERLLDLRAARHSGDRIQVAGLLRSGLLRNFGGISSKRLYNKSHVGTKILIEEYVAEVLECLKFVAGEKGEVEDSLAKSETAELKVKPAEKSKGTSDLAVDSKLWPAKQSTKKAAASFYQSPSTVRQARLDFFHDARQTIGTTALILQGGTLFGLCHIGVIKALHDHELLPRVIAGSSIGAVVGAYVCSLRPEELSYNLDHLVEQINPPTLNGKSQYDNILENVLNKGFSQDILIFIDYVATRLGDMTFEEAHVKTGMILNIVIFPTDSSVPSLLNYLSAPNTVISSAVRCSLGYNVLHEDTYLYVKNERGEVVPYESACKDCRFMSPYYARTFGEKRLRQSVDFVSPYTRLTELFNVNHFVVSLARPYLAPLIGIDLRHTESRWPFIKKIDRLLNLEIRYRVEMLDRMGLLLSFLRWALSDETAPLYAGNQIPVVPEMKTLFHDCKRLFDVGKYRENIPYWIHVGEHSVWPLYPLLRTRCAIEFTLDDYYNLFRERTETKASK